MGRQLPLTISPSPIAYAPTADIDLHELERIKMFDS
jgi:hypothetical protein